MDAVGAKDARDLIAAGQIAVPMMAQTVIDRCMQIHGAGGLTGDYFMAEAFNYARWCRSSGRSRPGAYDGARQTSDPGTRGLKLSVSDRYNLRR